MPGRPRAAGNLSYSYPALAALDALNDECLPLSAGARLAGPFGQDREEGVHALQSVGDGRPPLATSAVGAQFEVLANGHGAEQQPALGDEREPLSYEPFRFR